MSSDATWKPVRSLQECNAILTGPGSFHELEHAIIDGRVYRVFKNLWPTIRAYWSSTISQRTDLHTQTFIVFGDTRLTYGQADELIQRTASIFREVYGVRKGDRVGIVMRNYPEWIISFFAAGLLGAIPTAFNAWLPIEPFLHCIQLTTPKVLLLDAERLMILRPHLAAIRIPVILVHPGSGKSVLGPRITEWTKALSSYTGSIKAWQKEPDGHPDDNATVFFTSGTTGLPKAVLSTNRGFLGNTFILMLTTRRRELRLGQDLPPPVGQGPLQQPANPPATLLGVPLFHVAGCTAQLMSSTTIGAKIVLMQKWDRDLAAELIHKENITTAAGVPAMIYDLLESNAQGNPKIEAISTGGAAAASTLIGEVIKTFPNSVMQQAYGLSETNCLSTAVIGEDYLARPGSAGLPPPNVELLIVDPNTKKVLPAGQIGEVWIRGPNIMRGYYNDDKATAEAITQDGWFKSGDLGSLDEEGFIYIKDRAKDMIIRGGENIHSVMVENALFADKRVMDCAVVGIPDKRLGELVGAVVVPREEWAGEVSEEEILKEVKDRLPAFAVPSLIIVRNETLERNAAGKTLKQHVRKVVAKEWEQRRGGKAKL